MEEEWIEIAGFEGIYYISNVGRVRKGNKFLKLSPNKNRRGYCYANLETSSKRKNSLVHQLVARHFIPNPENKRCVNHINFDVSDNQVSNLEWATHQENMNHSKVHGRMASPHGEKGGNSKLTLEVVRAIRKEREENGTTYIALATKYNTNYSNVAHIMRGSRWGKDI